jgi:hypothetical protein
MGPCCARSRPATNAMSRPAPLGAYRSDGARKGGAIADGGDVRCGWPLSTKTDASSISRPREPAFRRFRWVWCGVTAYLGILRNAARSASRSKGLRNRASAGSIVPHSLGVAVMNIAGIYPRRPRISATAAGPRPSKSCTSEVIIAGRHASAAATASRWVSAKSNDVAPSSARSDCMSIARNGSSSITKT